MKKLNLTHDEIEEKVKNEEANWIMNDTILVMKTGEIYNLKTGNQFKPYTRNKHIHSCITLKENPVQSSIIVAEAFGLDWKNNSISYIDNNPDNIALNNLQLTPITSSYKDVSDYPYSVKFRDSHYSVTKEGNIVNIITGKVMSQFMNSITSGKRHGYMMTNIYFNNKVKVNVVHSFVAEAFLGPRPLGLVINHIDGNRMNNRLENLEYITPQQNLVHGQRRRTIVLLDNIFYNPLYVNLKAKENAKKALERRNLKKALEDNKQVNKPINSNVTFFINKPSK